MIKSPETGLKTAKAGEILSQSSSADSETPLVPLLKPEHPLVKLAGAIDWNYFEAEFSNQTIEVGRPALPTRLVVGWHYLKAMYDESDELVVEMLEKQFEDTIRDEQNNGLQNKLSSQIIHDKDCAPAYSSELKTANI
jgi:hypothetical protein